MRFFCGGLLICLAVGCGGSATTESKALTNAEASAMVAEETKATPLAFNVGGAPTVEFSVPDMMCEVSCVPTVRDTLAKQPGVKEVKVELATKTAIVAVDKDEFDPQAAVAALVDLQFKNTKLAESSAAATN